VKLHLNAPAIRDGITKAFAGNVSKACATAKLDRSTFYRQLSGKQEATLETFVRLSIALVSAIASPLDLLIIEDTE
jgi:DNA-binding phage protein